MKRLVWQAFLLVMGAFLCALISNAVAGPERRLSWLARPAAAAARKGSPTEIVPNTTRPSVPGPGPQSAFPPHPDKPFVEISGEDARGLFEKGVAFFDARRSSVYREGHVAGARAFPVWEAGVDDQVRGLVADGLDPSTPIVVYCSGGECEDSHMLAQKLYMAGFDDVLVYKDGFPDWQKRALPVRKGDRP